MYGEVLS